MSDIESRILIAVRKTLTEIIRDTATPPGMRHPLTDETLVSIRECLKLVTARERDIAGPEGTRPVRPYYTDEPKS